MREACQPLRGKVLIRPMEPAGETAGGIIIPDEANARPREGEVVAVGDGKLSGRGVELAPSVKVGLRVVFGEWAGTTRVRIDDEELMMLKEEEILCVYD